MTAAHTATNTAGAIKKDYPFRRITFGAVAVGMAVVGLLARRAGWWPGRQLEVAGEAGQE
jgi:hypothetical protein